MTRREKLEALRDQLEASGFEAAAGGLNAALVREYRAVLEELEGLPDEARVSKHDELRRRREGRGATSEAV